VRIEALESSPEPRSFNPSVDANISSSSSSDVTFNSWTTTHSNSLYGIVENPHYVGHSSSSNASAYSYNNAQSSDAWNAVSFGCGTDARGTYSSGVYGIPNSNATRVSSASFKFYNTAPGSIVHSSVGGAYSASTENVYASSGYGVGHDMVINPAYVGPTNDPQSYGQCDIYPVTASIDAFSNSILGHSADVDVQYSNDVPLDALDFDFPLLPDEYDSDLPDEYGSDLEELIKNLTPTLSFADNFKRTHSLEIMDAATQRDNAGDIYIVDCDPWSEAKDHDAIQKGSNDNKMSEGNIESPAVRDDVQYKLDKFDLLFPDEMDACLNIIDQSHGMQEKNSCPLAAVTANHNSGSINCVVGAQPEQKTGIIGQLMRTLSTSAPRLSSLGVSRSQNGTLPKLQDVRPPGEVNSVGSNPISPGIFSDPSEMDKVSSVGSTNIVFSAIFNRTYSFSRRNTPVESIPAISSVQAPKSALANFLSLHSPLGESITPSHAPKRTRKFLF